MLRGALQEDVRGIAKTMLMRGLMEVERPFHLRVKVDLKQTHDEEGGDLD